MAVRMCGGCVFGCEGVWVCVRVHECVCACVYMCACVMCVHVCVFFGGVYRIFRVPFIFKEINI